MKKLRICECCGDPIYGTRFCSIACTHSYKITIAYNLTKGEMDLLLSAVKTIILTHKKNLEVKPKP